MKLAKFEGGPLDGKVSEFPDDVDFPAEAHVAENVEGYIAWYRMPVVPLTLTYRRTSMSALTDVAEANARHVAPGAVYCYVEP